jgi:hypothetical protein
MKKLYRILLLIIIYQQTSSTVRISLINNAIFDPINKNYLLANLSNIESCSSCICQCYAISNCIIANYYGYRQQCILFSTPLQPQQLHVISISENATVIIMNSTNYASKELLEDVNKKKSCIDNHFLSMRIIENSIFRLCADNDQYFLFFFAEVATTQTSRLLTTSYTSK